MALPFPLDEALCGRDPPEDRDAIFPDQIAIQGERGLLRFPDDWLLRLRHNPFYDLLEARTLEWMGRGRPRGGHVARPAATNLIGILGAAEPDVSPVVAQRFAGMAVAEGATEPVGLLSEGPVRPRADDMRLGIL